jgi:uncharacterized protein YecA (UPF0149 family)
MKTYKNKHALKVMSAKHTRQTQNVAMLVALTPQRWLLAVFGPEGEFGKFSVRITISLRNYSSLEI